MIRHRICDRDQLGGGSVWSAHCTWADGVHIALGKGPAFLREVVREGLGVGSIEPEIRTRRGKSFTKRGGLLTKLLDRPPGLFQLLRREAGFQSVLSVVGAGDSTGGSQR